MQVAFMIVGFALAFAGELVAYNPHHTGTPPTMHTMDSTGNGSGSGSGGSISGGGPVG